MPAGYLPAPNADFANWLDNFSTLLTASPATYGLVAGDATAVAAQDAAYQAAYSAATDPGTRGPATVAAAVAARTAAEAVVRPYAVTIARNPAVAPDDKVAIGVSLPNPSRPRIPAPTTAPSLILVSCVPNIINFQFRDSTTPLVKAKPVGVTGMELWAAFGTVPAVSPDQCTFQQMATKTPGQLDTTGQSGKICTMFGRWANRSGHAGVAYTGPFSLPLVIMTV